MPRWPWLERLHGATPLEHADHRITVLLHQCASFYLILVQVTLCMVLRCPRTKGGFCYPHPAVQQVGLISLNSVRLHGTARGNLWGSECTGLSTYNGSNSSWIIIINSSWIRHISADPFRSTSRNHQLMGVAPRCPSVAPLAMESPRCAFAHSITAAHCVKAHTAACVYLCACTSCLRMFMCLYATRPS